MLTLVLVCITVLASDCDHAYDDELCDPDCNICGEERVPWHLPDTSEGWLAGGGYHYYPCKLCNQPAFLAPHETLDGYGYTDEGHYFECRHCQASVSGESHVFTSEYTENRHTLKCVCGYAISQKHVFDSECDADCALCGYQQDTSHGELEYLISGNRHTAKCTVCGTVLGEEVHGGGEYSYNGIGHWQYCAVCSEYLGLFSHECLLKIGVDGREEYVCECGYKESVPVADGNDGDSVLLIITVSVFSGAFASAVVVIAFMKRDYIREMVKKIKKLLKKSKK